MLNEAEKESQLALGHPLSILDSHPTSRCQTVHKFLSGVINISEFLSRNLYKGHCLPKEVQKNYDIIGFFSKVEKILKGSLNSIPSPSPSVKIQIIGGKVYWR